MTGDTTTILGKCSDLQYCPACGHDGGDGAHTLIGDMGPRVYVRCRACEIVFFAVRSWEERTEAYEEKTGRPWPTGKVTS